MRHPEAAHFHKEIYRNPSGVGILIGPSESPENTDPAAGGSDPLPCGVSSCVRRAASHTTHCSTLLTFAISSGVSFSGTLRITPSRIALANDDGAR